MTIFDRFKFKVENGKIVGYKLNKKEVTISGSISTIAHHAFSKSDLETIYVKEGVKVLESGCFSKMKKLKSVFLPSSLVDIGTSIFSGDENLEMVSLPKNLTIIPLGMFNNCKSLELLGTSSKLSSVEDRAFYNCRRLKNVDIGENLSYIGIQAFYNSGIKEINLDSCKVRSIREQTFYGCCNLTRFVTGRNLINIEEEAFLECKKLEFVRLTNGLSKIGRRAFKSTGIKKLILPDTIVDIEEEAFGNCSNLTNLVLPRKIREIPKKCFKNCHSLHVIYFPSNLERIGESAFENCYSIKEVVIPKTVSLIEKNAFSNCSYLKRIVIENDDVNLEGNIFSNCYSLEKIVYCGKEIDVSNLVIDNIDKNFLQELIKNENKLSKIKVPVSVKCLNELNKVGLLEEFLDNSYYKNYNRLYSKLFGVDRFNIDGKNSFFKLCYSLGVFNRETTQKSSELIYDYIDRGMIDDLLIKNMVNELTYKPIDINMINTINDRSLPFFSDVIKHSKSEIGFLGKCLEEYNNVQSTNKTNKGEHRQLKPTLRKFINYFDNDKFSGIDNERDFNLSIEIGKFYDEQRVFDKAKKIFNKFYESGIQESIISESKRKEAYERIDNSKRKIMVMRRDFSKILKEIHYEFLKKSDPKNLTIGKYCDSCCAHIEGIGESICNASVLDPLTQTLVITNRFDDILSKATFTINEEFGAIVINTIQVNKSRILENEQKIADKYMEAFKNLIIDYNENHQTKITRIYLGTNKSHLTEYFKANEEDFVCPSINYSKYGEVGSYPGDWMKGQLCIYKFTPNNGIL